MTIHRRTQAIKFVKLTPLVIAMIEELIRKDLSPEQISGFLTRTHHLRVSHEAIYQHILKNKATEGTLYRHLRCSHKKHKKRYGSHDRRGRIPARISIDERPAIVETRERIGDWEIDTIIVRRHKGALLSLVER
jgi:IS30 family transposase